MKMYILLKEGLSPGHAALAAAHAALAGYLKFQHSPEVAEWLSGRFYKVICSVDAAQFEKAKEIGDHQVMTESALDGQEVAIVFKPRADWPKVFKSYRLYRG